jgi:GDP-4-dehydro-6-deoxy-D-mannose reductase
MIVMENQQNPDIKKKLEPLYESGILVDERNWSDYLKKFNNTSAVPSKEFWNGKKVMITGVGGFLGSNLAEKILGYGSDVVGIVANHDLKKYPNIADLRDRMKLYICDLSDYGQVEDIIKSEKPETVFHYAAISFVPKSVEQPNIVFQNNVASTTNILHATARHNKEATFKIYTALSSEQYGFGKDLSEFPISEDNPFRPCSPYAVSKIATEMIGESYHYSDDLPVLRIRTFNQEGVGDPIDIKRARDDRFFTATVAKQIAMYLAGKTDKIAIGNQNALRDFIDVKDSINAHLLAVEKCEPNEPYNVCTNYGILTGDFARIACKLFGIPPEKIITDIQKTRQYESYPAFVHGFVGNNKKFREKTGWAPTRSMKGIIEESVKYQQEVSA